MSKVKCFIFESFAIHFGWYILHKLDGHQI